MKSGKIIIFEGLDRTGKNTQIELLKEYFYKNNNTFLEFHFGKPPELSKKEMINISKKMYDNTFDFMLKSIKIPQNFILNRFHCGEFVYAPLYRNYSGEYIFNIEKKYYKKYIKEWNNIYLIIFIDSPKNLMKREDGNSFSNNETLKQKEINGFIEVFKKSYIKNKIFINIDGKSIKDIYKEICIFLGIKND
jgi:thymidylate kinase